MAAANPTPVRKVSPVTSASAAQRPAALGSDSATPTQNATSARELPGELTYSAVFASSLTGDKRYL